MKIVKVLQTTLSAPFAANDVSLTVRAFLDSKSIQVALSSFGANGFLVVVLKQGDTTEMLKINSITPNDDGSSELGVMSNGRDIDPTSPYASYSSGQDFQTGADVIVTNDPLTMETFANLAESNIFTGSNIFNEVPSTLADPVGNNDLTRKSWVTELILGTLTTIDVIVPGTAGATIAQGNLVYFDTGSNTWKLAEADMPATVNDVLLGIAQGTGTASNPIANGVLLQGIDSHQSGMTPGVAQYASNTPGAISASPGTATVGVGVAKDGTNLYFDPRFNQQITQDQLNALAGTSGTTPSDTNKLVDAADVATVATPGKIIRANANGVIDQTFLGGAKSTGVDGALNVTSGTTTLNDATKIVGNYAIYNFTTGNISSGAILTTGANFLNKILVLKFSGAVTIAGTIELAGLGGAGGALATAGAVGANLLPYSVGLPGATTIAAPGAGGQLTDFTDFDIWCGSGGGGGVTKGYTGGIGGAGGGSLLLISTSTVSFTGTIDVSGVNGSDAQNEVSNNFLTADAGSGGAGGGAGSVLFVVASLAADATKYTVNINGGTGGNGSRHTGSSGGSVPAQAAASGAGGGASGNKAGTIGSNGGTDTSGASPQGNGGAGAQGRFKVVRLTPFSLSAISI